LTHTGVDASGVAVIMAIMRILKANNYQGNYAIEAHAYAGEEGGLLGAKTLAASYKAAGKTVRGMLDFEMIGKLHTTTPRLTFLSDCTNYV
jgi:Zn-dependent M28 family amino/carboxypeptidase